MSSDCVRRTVHGTVAFSMWGRLPIRQQLATPPPAPGIHLVLRSLTPRVYGGVNWIGPRERRLPERECDPGYMQYLSLETPTGTPSRGPTGRDWQRKGRFGEGATGGKRETTSRINTQTTSTKDEVRTYMQARHGCPRHARNSVAIYIRIVSLGHTPGTPGRKR